MIATTHMSTQTLAHAPSRTDRRFVLLAVSALVILLDRLSKLWIVNHLAPGAAIPVIPSVFRITHVLNTGAAFSMFAESASPTTVRNGLVAFSVFAVIVIAVMLYRTGRTITLSSLAFALILGGAIGNLFDRVRLHYVVDFLEVHIGSYHWPDFNLADSAIVIGACLLMLEIFQPAHKSAN